MPDDLAETFEHVVLRIVLALARAQALVLRPYAGRLIDRQLLLDREVQAQVQERIDLAAFRRIVAIAMTFGRGDDRLIFGMVEQDLQRHGLEPGQRLPGAILTPGLEE